MESVANFRSRFPALSIADIENEARTTRVQAYCGNLCIGQLQYEYALIATKLLANKSSDNTIFLDFYQHTTEMGWAAAFEKAFGLSVETFYQELEEFLQQPLAVQKAQLRHPPAPTPTPTPNAGVVRILPGGSLSSPGGRYRLVYQSDGNLVLSDVLAGTALWATDTGGTAPGQAIVQSDGNFVIYDAAGSALWTAGTAGNPGAYLRIQDDGNVVIYGANARPIWSRLTGSLLPD